MIKEVTVGRPSVDLARILGMIRGGNPTPVQVEPGIIVATHWSVDKLLGRSWDAWWYDSDETLPPAFGVCDSIEQFKDKYLEQLKADPEHQYAVSFVVIRRSEEPAEGGWRWHKWGEYIGTQNPQCEYIHDEPEIEEVWTFSVHRRSASCF